LVVAADAVAGLDRLSVDEDVAGLDGLLEQGAGVVGELGGEVGVEPAAFGLATDYQFENVSGHEALQGRAGSVSDRSCDKTPVANAPGSPVVSSFSAAAESFRVRPCG